MAKVNFELRLEGGEMDGAYRRFTPGARIAGDAHVFPRQEINARRIVARLQWHTEGRGDKNAGVAEETVLAEGPLTPSIPQSFSFDFTAPQEPWSYAGHYINIIWEVQIVVDIPWASDELYRERIILAPAWTAS
jgi:hypothetical protein